MLKDCLEVFEKKYSEDGEKLITDSCVLGEGSYVLVDENGEIAEILEVNKKKIKKTSSYYEFAQMDYLSKLVDINKPIDPSKIIHSNNYLSFFVKKENVNKLTLTEDIIDNYYEILKDQRIKYRDKKYDEKRNMYEVVENKYGKSDCCLIEKQKAWIKNNIFLLIDKVIKNKSYLKIFLNCDIQLYKKESEKYVIPNIYNRTQLNVKIDNITYGVPNNNMGLNLKKPFLENRTRRNPSPYILSIHEVLMQKKFFDFLFNNACMGKTNIYIGNGDIKCLSDIEHLDGRFSGYYMRTIKGKEIEIRDFDTIVEFNNLITGLIVNEAIPRDNRPYKGVLNKDYVEIKDISELKSLINNIFFNKALSNNYLTDPKDIRINEFKIKEMLIRSRGAFFNWFYKGDTTIIKQIFGKTSMEIIKSTICSEYKIKAKEQFNLRSGILDYFIGGKKMADILYEIVTCLREKVNSKETKKIESDNEYYFAVGQISSYLLSLKKSSGRMHSLINPLLNCKTDEKLKLQLEVLFKKYNYFIKKESKRFNNFSAMVLGYQAESQVNENILVAGYLYTNLIYERTKLEENTSEK